MNGLGVREEKMVLLRYKVNCSAAYDRHVIGASPRRSQRRGVSPLLSMVRDSSVTVVSGASRIPFVRSRIDPAVSAQVRLLKHKPQRGSSYPALMRTQEDHESSESPLSSGHRYLDSRRDVLGQLQKLALTRHLGCRRSITMWTKSPKNLVLYTQFFSLGNNGNTEVCNS